MITKLYKAVRTGCLYNRTKNDTSSYFRSEVTTKKTSRKCQLPYPTIWRRISRQRFNPRSPNFPSATIWLTNVQDLSPLAAFGRPQNVTNWILHKRAYNGFSRQSQIIRPWFDARSPLMTQRMSAEIFKLIGKAFRLIPQSHKICGLSCLFSGS